MIPYESIINRPIGELHFYILGLVSVSCYNEFMQTEKTQKQLLDNVMKEKERRKRLSEYRKSVGEYKQLAILDVFRVNPTARREDLAKTTGLSTRQVSRHIKALVASSKIKVSYSGFQAVVGYRTKWFVEVL